MNLIKYILIFFVFIISTLIGNLYSKKYSNRLDELEKLKNILNIFKAKIKFSCIPIQDIFMELYENNKDNIGEILKNTNDYMNDNSAEEAWNKALKKAKETTNLNEEDITALETLGKMLGNTDIEGQVSQIELTENLLTKQIENAQEEKKKNSKLYKTLGVATGLTIAIILI